MENINMKTRQQRAKWILGKRKMGIPSRRNNLRKLMAALERSTCDKYCTGVG